ncbi:MAG: VOC family protein [Pseudomonadota bacterium]
MRPFHLAIPVHDVSVARDFYGRVLGCAEGRSAAQWVDFNFFEHQLVCHQVAGEDREAVAGVNPVDGERVPVPHFGVVLTRDQWDDVVGRLTNAQVAFRIPPTIRFEGTAGEQATCFVQDPSGNCLEFKAFADLEQLFARDA